MKTGHISLYSASIFGNNKDVPIFKTALAVGEEIHQEFYERISKVKELTIKLCAMPVEDGNVKECRNCLHVGANPFAEPCYECHSAGGYGNWKPVENIMNKKKQYFFEKCDELDAAIFTGDVIKFMDGADRQSFMAFMTHWLSAFAEACRFIEEEKK